MSDTCRGTSSGSAGASPSTFLSRPVSCFRFSRVSSSGSSGGERGPMSASAQETRNRTALLLAGYAAAIALGAPGCLGLVSGAAPRDWLVPFGLQHLGDFGLRTAIYLSGFLLSFGLIGLVTAASTRSTAGATDAAPAAAPSDSPAAGTDSSKVPLADPFYGFLPRKDQERLARATGYQPLLYTKISILISGAIGVLLAGSFDFPGETEPLPDAAVVRILVGLYLMAESAHRYIRFARGAPSGTLAGWLVSGLASAIPAGRSR